MPPPDWMHGMSRTATLVGEELATYVADHAPPEDEFLVSLKAAATAEEIPSIWISPEQAAFLRILLRGAGAREVIEVGTLAGVSAIAMARGLPEDGRVRTVEIEAKHADFAEKWIARSDVAGRIEVLRGDGREVLPTIADACADAAFIDADKAGYATYVDECARILRPGGLLLVDNAFAFGRLLEAGCDDPSVLAIREVNERLAADERFDGLILPVGDGCWMATRR